MGWVREKEHFSGIIAEGILEFVPYVVCLHRSNDVKELSVDRIAIKSDTGNFKATTLDAHHSFVEKRNKLLTSESRCRE